MPDGWTLVKPASSAAPPPASSDGWEMVRPAVTRKPASTDDFMRPEDIVNRDNTPGGSSVGRDIIRGVGKGAARTVASVAEMGAMALSPQAVNPAGLFNPVLRHPLFTRVAEATAANNPGETLGGRLEMVAEVGAPAVRAVKAAPAMAKGAVALAKKAGGMGPAAFDAATHLVPGGGYIRGARRLLAAALDKGGKFSEELPKVAEELQHPAVFTGTAAEAPATISATGGFSMPTARPSPTVAPPPGRVVAAVPRPSVKQVAADVLAEARLPSQPARVTTPPPASLPPGYTPRSTVPKAKQAKASLPEPASAPQPRKSVSFYDVVDSQPPPSKASVFRGITADELASIDKTGHIKSTGAFSHASEGTSFADDFASAESAVNYGRTNPGVTGKTTYVVEVKRGPEIAVDARDGWPKSKSPIPADRIVSVRSFHPDGTSTVTKNVAEALGKSPTRAPRQRPTASPPPNQGPPKRAYFLKSEDEIAAAAEPIEAVTPSGSIDVADLPASWQSRVGQDLFPTTGAEAKKITAALRAEIKDRGMTVGQAVLAVSKNKDIPTKLRTQIIRSFTASAK